MRRFGRRGGFLNVDRSSLQQVYRHRRNLRRRPRKMSHRGRSYYFGRTLGTSKASTLRRRPVRSAVGASMATSRTRRATRSKIRRAPTKKRKRLPYYILHKHLGTHAKWDGVGFTYMSNIGDNSNNEQGVFVAAPVSNGSWDAASLALYNQASTAIDNSHPISLSCNLKYTFLNRNTTPCEVGVYAMRLKRDLEANFAVTGHQPAEWTTMMNNVESPSYGSQYAMDDVRWRPWNYAVFKKLYSFKKLARRNLAAGESFYVKYKFTPKVLTKERVLSTDVQGFGGTYHYMRGDVHFLFIVNGSWVTSNTTSIGGGTIAEADNVDVKMTKDTYAVAIAREKTYTAHGPLNYDNGSKTEKRVGNQEVDNQLLEADSMRFVPEQEIAY